MGLNFRGENIAEVVEDRVYRLVDPPGMLVFRCQRKGHLTASAYTKVCSSLQDARDERGDHDGRLHGRTRASRKAGRGRAEALAERLTIESAWDAFLRGPGTLVDEQTVTTYRSLVNFLTRYAPFRERVIETILKEDADNFVAYMLKHSSSRGAQILKALEFLERLSQVNGRATLTFKVSKCFGPLLRAKVEESRREIPDVTVQQVQAFLDGLKGRAYVFALVKWLTGLRNVEVRNLRVRDFHLDEDDAWVEAVLHKKHRGKKELDWRSLGQRHVNVIRQYLAGRDPGSYAFPSSGRKALTDRGSRPAGNVDKSGFAKDFRKSAEAAGIMSTISEDECGYSGLDWMRHNRATLLASFEEDDGIGFTVEQRLAAEAAAAKSIGTGLKAFHLSYFLKKQKQAARRARGENWRDELRAKKRDAALIEATIVSNAANLHEWVFGQRSTTVFREMLRTPGVPLSGKDIALRCGADSKEEIRKFQVLVSTLARQGKLVRVRRGRFVIADSVPAVGIPLEAPRSSRQKGAARV